MWLALQTVSLGSIAYTTGKHNHLVVSIFLAILLMLEGEQRTRNQRLTELVAKIARTVRCLDENLLRCLIEPLANWQNILPIAQGWCTAVVFLQAGISSHIYSRSGNRPRADTTAHTVAYLTTRTSCCSIEWLNGSWEIVSLGFQRDNTLYRLHTKIVRCTLVGWCKLFDFWTLGEGYVVFIG